MGLTTYASSIFEADVFIPVKWHCNTGIIEVGLAFVHLRRTTDTLVCWPSVVGPLIVGSSIEKRFDVLGSNHTKRKFDLVCNAVVHVEPKRIS